MAGVGFPGASIPSGQQANFRTGATKLFLLWTDAPFHNPGDPGAVPYPGPSLQQTADAILALDPPKVVGISSGPFGVAGLQAIAKATGSLAPTGGIDCNGDGSIDVPEGQPLVCAIGSSGQGVAQAILAIVQGATAPMRIEVGIDVNPGGVPNSINMKSQGTIPVAILSSSTFDAPNRVDKTSLTFGRTGNEQSLTLCNNSAEDVNADGLLDQVCHFNTQATGFQSGDTVGMVKGNTVDGTLLQGTDSVRIVP
ncbi:MAG: hypothetical protein NT090_05310 [Acidobacteria bacterium]|nr:hypothetical protein [Acidobacteriota bacterium]